MQELEKMINIYHTGFIVCLVLACVFFAVSVLLFFKFNIRRIIDMKTGRGAKRTIQKMEEINARTGKLRQDMVSHTPSVLRPEDRIAYPVTAPNLNIQAEAASRNGGAAGNSIGSAAPGTVSGRQYSGQISEQSAQSQVTEKLVDDGSQETTVLNQSGETTVLSQNILDQVVQPEIKLPGPFKIIKEVMWVHTEEVL